LGLWLCILDDGKDASVSRAIAFGAALLLPLPACGEMVGGGGRLRRLAPDFPRRGATWDVMPFVAPMISAIIALSIFRGTAISLADAVLGR
jgi:hypothetical protein